MFYLTTQTGTLYTGNRRKPVTRDEMEAARYSTRGRAFGAARRLRGGSFTWNGYDMPFPIFTPLLATTWRRKYGEEK